MHLFGLHVVLLAVWEEELIVANIVFRRTVTSHDNISTLKHIQTHFTFLKIHLMFFVGAANSSSCFFFFFTFNPSHKMTHLNVSTPLYLYLCVYAYAWFGKGKPHSKNVLRVRLCLRVCLCATGL